MSVNRFNFPFFQGFEASTGNVGAGWKLYFWAAGSTSTAQTTYSDSARTVANANPVVADANGRWPDIFLADASYNVELKDENDVLLDSADDVGTATTSSAVVGKEIEAQTTTYGQTVFTLTGMTYTPGANNLEVYYNGVLAENGIDYTETSSTVITWKGATIAEGARMFFLKNSFVSSSAPLASNTAYTPNGTGAVATDVQTKLREFVSVKDFGAVGDGVTDDTAAIQAAIDAGRAVIITDSSSPYICSGLTLSSDDFELHFQGRAQLKSPSGTPGIPITISGDRVKVFNANIDGNTAFTTNERELINVSGDDVKLYNVRGVNSSRHVVFVDGGNGFYADYIYGKDCDKDVYQVIRSNNTYVDKVYGNTCRYVAAIEQETNRTEIGKVIGDTCTSVLTLKTGAGAVSGHDDVVVGSVSGNACGSAITSISGAAVDNYGVRIGSIDGEGWTDLTTYYASFFRCYGLRVNNMRVRDRDSATAQQLFVINCYDVIFRDTDYKVLTAGDEHFRFQDCSFVEVAGGSFISSGDELFWLYNKDDASNTDFRFHDFYLDLQDTNDLFRILRTTALTDIRVSNINAVTLANRFTSDSEITWSNIVGATDDSGTATFSGTGSQTTFDITIALTDTPVSYSVTPTSAAANGDFYISAATSQLLRIEFASAPASGTDNVTFNYSATIT